jgi:hypothetical protein
MQLEFSSYAALYEGGWKIQGTCASCCSTPAILRFLARREQSSLRNTPTFASGILLEASLDEFTKVDFDCG